MRRLLERLWRLWVAYRAAIRQEAEGVEAGWDANVRRLYLARYRYRRHGRRDDRPQHWRKYLETPAARQD